MPSSRSFRFALLAAATAVVLAGCAAGGGAASTSGTQASGKPASGGPSASDAPASVGPSASVEPGTSTGTFTGKACDIVKVEDVTAIYGGNVKALGAGENGACNFEIEGKAKAGESAAAGEFAVSFGDSWSSYDKVKVVFGDSVTKIEGLGTDAYSALGFIHAKAGAGELVVGGVWIGNYDRAKLADETFEMTKLLLGRL